MGAPRKLRRKFSGPGHPWQKARIDEEKALKKEYGLKNKSEIWKHNSKLKNFAKQAKRLVALQGEQAEKEKKQLLERLQKLGLISAGADTEAVLSLTIKDILERRLQTIVYRKGLANSMRQARQYISHAHILVGGKQIKAPGYIVKTEEEPTITFVEASALSNPEHPERQIEKKPEETEEKAEDKKTKKVKKKKRTKKAFKKSAKKQEPRK
ncbi:30S ribosomal protein S4 [Candidatus Woesearchaeota archaeon]|nr:30S ribosomal protein S4 [Candidatus Woesearchaeota archaeon]MBW3005696.1 30S ribosomal protein S4 [Candidatus Woesearchaeota archaeon]